MQCPGKEDEHLREEKGEVVEAKLPTNDSTDHEESSTAENDSREKDNDLSMGGSRRVWGEGEL